jgi:hypothetical protein
MTFSKHLPFLCAIAVGAICLTVRADDSDNAAQAAARIAIAKALFQQQSSNAPATWASPAETNAVMHPVNEKDAKAKAKADKAAAKAKAKADKEAADAKAKQDAAQAEADKKVKAEADKKAAADAKAAAEQQQAQAIADKASADAAAKAAAEQKENAEKAAIAAATPATTNTETPAQNTTSTATNSWASTMTTNNQSATPAIKEKKKKKEKEAEKEIAPKQPPVPDFKPIAAPPLPISASKQDRLAALLQKYQADQITPDEYHSQRAAILAEP